MELTTEQRVRAEVAKEEREKHFRTELERVSGVVSKIDAAAKAADSSLAELKAVTSHPTEDDFAKLDALNIKLCGLLRN